jgi:serine/threonine-protein kinase
VTLFRQGRLASARAQFAEAARLAPNNADVHNNRAMIWATSPEAQYRDGRRAVASATRACELTGWKNASTLDSLAAAWAEAGDFAQAVKWQSRALDLLTDARKTEDFRSRLRLYQAGQPYRETLAGR